ncbi:hypothetical protein MTP04_26060 [Lysinibacillus sp. PLM2]|nr:hypothetical protein MTP04_26060 [Lysinibacillus sp. PLM2]
MNYNIILYNEMKTIIQTTPNLQNHLRSQLLQYIDTKKDHPMIFGNLCVLHYCEFTEEFNPEIYRIAAAVELLVLSFDIIDDLQDQDTSNIWTSTPDLSMNAALAMIFILSNVILESNFNHKHHARIVLDMYALDSINGQQLDLLNSCQSEESYLNMISLKSGSLVTLSCLVGVVLAQGDIDIRVKEYSNLIGVIQQIENDISDVQSINGKNDLLNKKYSLPIIYIFEKQNDVSKHLEDYYQGLVTSMDIDFVKKELFFGGALHYAKAIRNMYRIKALEYIEDVTMKEESKEYIKNLMK